MLLKGEINMLSTEGIMQLIGSLIWLLAGVGVFIVGMNFMSEALEKSAGEGMKRMLGRISNNRFSGGWYWCGSYRYHPKLIGDIGYGYRSG